MKSYEFTVVFTNHTFRVVYTGNREQAIILAQAEQIKAGMSYNVCFVKDENGNVIY